MPYIDPQRRDEILDGTDCTNPGELNFRITVLLNDYIYANKLNYQTINDIVGALEGAKLEFYRRVAAPYENGKIEANGDVY